MAIPGQRFVVDLDDEQGINVDNTPAAFDPSSISPFGLIGEIRERSPSAAVPPAPKPPTGSTGFPQHRRRVNQSAFKQRRANKQLESATSTPRAVSDEKKSIDEENRRQLASMSPGQIELEKEELMASMDSSLLQRFLRRAQIDDDNAMPASSTPSSTQDPAAKPRKSVSFDIAENPGEATTQTAQQHSPQHRRKFNPSVTSSVLTPEDRAPAQPPSDLLPASEFPNHDAFHFPTPPQQRTAPNLDPSSPSFLSDLQAHYFPEISHNPSAISWLQPPSADAEDPDSTSAYHPASNAAAIHPSALRFSLIGTILSPSTSLSLPTTLGLHHHGNDPHAAGYTIPELAILSRSSFPAQRCIAWQVLGRILYRLGKGQFGEPGSPLVEGLWSVIEHEGVVAGMLTEAEGASAGPTRSSFSSSSSSSSAVANRTDPSSSAGGAAGPATSGSGIGRHASASAWAVEGVWLWQTGGSGDRGILKENQIRSQ
ncbi:RPAP1 family protein [Aspergillus clavatus NRRL 1]|uniref:Transcription factor Rba50, putative n=1 Tax=Aspergillus clavatus (strain ATCC 1007 / CBS 513.65 / DSM 816 / NCTC 3887 / NRRL 1 / QM 1276 / 107) TaxID=344612 RepID=A1CJ62_ASPCL|nr:transcription factor Rba50, putative [Aspergillus clavatus NRRL 1]EAW09186.1 transcription factor Rba50, putative [Aspergillus clavatus NRRL 1]